MKRSLIALAALACLVSASPLRARTADISYGYRMPVGFPGDVNRTHPASILPGLMDSTDPVSLYGNPVLIDTVANSYRGIVAADVGIVKIAGVLVRPYPTQQQTGGMSASIGTAVPPPGPAVCDVIEEGYVIARCNNFATVNPTKGGAVFVWVTASAGAHLQGGFESAADGVNTIAITNARWNGPVGADGVGELQVWVA